MHVVGPSPFQLPPIHSKRPQSIPMASNPFPTAPPHLHTQGFPLDELKAVAFSIRPEMCSTTSAPASIERFPQVMRLAQMKNKGVSKPSPRDSIELLVDNLLDRRGDECHDLTGVLLVIPLLGIALLGGRPSGRRSSRARGGRSSSSFRR
jgi:hypothetical protein